MQKHEIGEIAGIDGLDDSAGDYEAWSHDDVFPFRSRQAGWGGQK